VFRPTGFADLAQRRVGIFGYGVEGRASAARLVGVAQGLVLVDDAPAPGSGVLATDEGGLEQLLTCDVVLKSPGIPRRRSDVLAIEAAGVCVTSALNLWLHDVDRSRVIAVTGTKGKSTTTALVAFFLECLGERAQRLGNIGQPPYDPDVDDHEGWLVLEVSSFQCVDLDVAPGIVVVTSLGADHLDWHGSLDEYRSDKLSLTRTRGEHTTLVPDTELFHSLTSQLGGDLVFIDADREHLASSLGLLGSHSDSNVALALAAVALATATSGDHVRRRVEENATAFVPLRGRLTLVATEQHNGATLRYVDDGLATSALPTVAALDVFAHDPVALIVGGFDRGVEYSPIAEALDQRSATTFLITMGPAGERIGRAATAVDPGLVVDHVSTMSDAVRRARALLVEGGVVLLSPGAPSFDQYRNWQERSDDFASVVRSLIGP